MNSKKGPWFWKQCQGRGLFGLGVIDWCKCTQIWNSKKIKNIKGRPWNICKEISKNHDGIPYYFGLNKIQKI